MKSGLSRPTLVAFGLVGLTLSICVSCALSNRPTTTINPRIPASENYDPTVHANAAWVVDPRAAPGPDTPPVGRSAFDRLIAQADGSYNVPYPFTSLLTKIKSSLVPSSNEWIGLDTGILGVLFPHGRSLQRNTPFHSPRVVIAVQGEPRQEKGSLGLLLQNRLYVGYSEEGGLLEVLSYNEEAARFEFEVVRDYQAGKTRRFSTRPAAFVRSAIKTRRPFFRCPTGKNQTHQSQSKQN